MKLSKVSRGSSGEPPSASCTAEIGAAAMRNSTPLYLLSRSSRRTTGVSAGFAFATMVRSTAERTVSSMRMTEGISACQQPMSFSA